METQDREDHQAFPVTEACQDLLVHQETGEPSEHKVHPVRQAIKESRDHQAVRAYQAHPEILDFQARTENADRKVNEEQKELLASKDQWDLSGQLGQEESLGLQETTADLEFQALRVHLDWMERTAKLELRELLDCPVHKGCQGLKANRDWVVAQGKTDLQDHRVYAEKEVVEENQVFQDQQDQRVQLEKLVSQDGRVN